MTRENIRAADVRVGDRIYDAAFYGPDKWCPVQAIESMPPYVMLDLGHVKIGKHEREGVAVIRDAERSYNHELRDRIRRWWAEYDSAADYCARRGVRGVQGDPLPANLSAECKAAIDDDPEAFERRVREVAYGLAELRRLEAERSYNYELRDRISRAGNGPLPPSRDFGTD